MGHICNKNIFARFIETNCRHLLEANIWSCPAVSRSWFEAVFYNMIPNLAQPVLAMSKWVVLQCNWSILEKYENAWAFTYHPRFPNCTVLFRKSPFSCYGLRDTHKIKVVGQTVWLWECLQTDTHTHTQKDGSDSITSTVDAGGNKKLLGLDGIIDIDVQI